jgi:uncharacterized LabA/DUF88 family protein
MKIDNSNIYHSGQQAHAKLKNMIQAKNPAWRMEMSKLIKVILGRDRVFATGPGLNGRPHVFGSLLPTQSDKIFKAFGHHCDVTIVRRNSFSSREKEVDTMIGIAAKNAEFDNYETKRNFETLILVTGDGDFSPLVDDLLGRVHTFHTQVGSAHTVPRQLDFPH